MNIEESVEYLKNCLNDEYNFKNATRKKDKEAIETLLTAYEKEKEKNKELEDTLKQTQNSWFEDTQKIEELKKNKGYHLGFIDGGIAKKYEMEDKIKAKIEEIEKELEDIELKNINKDEISKTTFYFIDRLKCKIDVLQSLLEKE